MAEAVNYYHKALHLGCCSSPRSTSDNYGRSVFVRNIWKFLNDSTWREERHNSGNIDSSPSLEISDDNFGISDSVADKFRHIRKQLLKNPRIIIIGHLNINLFRNNFWNNCWNYGKFWHIFNFRTKIRPNFPRRVGSNK